MRIKIQIYLNSGQEIMLEDNIDEDKIDDVRSSILEIYKSPKIIEFETFNLVNSYVTLRPSDVSLIRLTEETKNKLEEIKDEKR
jgi:uncharacterized protein Veg